MRIFSGDSADIPEVKYRLYRYKEYLKACGLTTGRYTGRLSDGRTISISSIDGIDNIIVEKAKKSLEKFKLPKAAQEYTNAIVWAGACDYADFTFDNFRKFWGATIDREPLNSVPEECTLLYIAPPNSRALTTDELEAIYKWKKVDRKLILHLGEDNDDIVVRLNAIADAVSSDLFFTDMFSGSDIILVPWIYDIFKYDYSGLHSKVNFNGYTKPFLVNGFQKSISAYHFTDSITNYHGLTYLPGSTMWGTPWPALVNASSVMTRFGCDFPKKVPAGYSYEDEYRYQYAYGSSYQHYLTGPSGERDAEGTFYFDKCFNEWNPDYESYGYDVEPQIAFKNNVMFMATGMDWCSHVDATRPYYGNVEMMLAILLEEWAPKPFSMKPSLPLQFAYNLPYAYRVTSYEPIT